jgi:hypothetical protein
VILVETDAPGPVGNAVIVLLLCAALAMVLWWGRDRSA